MKPQLPDWVVDYFSFEGGRVRANGWMLPSTSGGNRSVLVNNQPSELSILTPRDDLVEAWAPASRWAVPLGFDLRANIAPEVEEVELVFCEDGRIHRDIAWHVRTAPERFPVPEPHRRERVHGTPDSYPFLRNGLTNYRRLRMIADRLLEPSSAKRVLDWGCGAGAIARYVESDWTYTGVDIDNDNVKWCQDNLGPLGFQAIDRTPPMPFADTSFDLIIGVSVMTHLREDDQRLWLNELKRVLRPGGLCLLSVLGVQAIAKDRTLDAAGSPLVMNGVVFGESEHEIGRSVGEPNYYGTAFHLEPYIRKEWSKALNVVGYFPAALGHQDVVALKSSI